MNILGLGGTASGPNQAGVIGSVNQSGMQAKKRTVEKPLNGVTILANLDDTLIEGGLERQPMQDAMKDALFKLLLVSICSQ